MSLPVGEIQGTANGCAQCGQQFGALAQFDAHQDVDYERVPVIVCRRPADLGLVRDDRGVWQTPQGLAMREAHRKTLRSWNACGGHARGAQAPAEASPVPQ